MTISLDDFCNDVYIDYAFEEVLFRYEKETKKVFRRFYGEEEYEISHTSDLYHDAIACGKKIDHATYYSK